MVYDGLQKLLLGSAEADVGLGVDIGGHILEGRMNARNALDSVGV